MSKASEWAAKRQLDHQEIDLLTAKIPPAPSFDFSWVDRFPAGGSICGGQAHVNQDGKLTLRCYRGDADLLPEQALALALWILATFGESP